MRHDHQTSIYLLPENDEDYKMMLAKEIAMIHGEDLYVVDLVRVECESPTWGEPSFSVFDEALKALNALKEIAYRQKSVLDSLNLTPSNLDQIGKRFGDGVIIYQRPFTPKTYLAVGYLGNEECFHLDEEHMVWMVETQKWVQQGMLYHTFEFEKVWDFNWIHKQ